MKQIILIIYTFLLMLRLQFKQLLELIKEKINCKNLFPNL